MPADRVLEGRWDCDACGTTGIGGLKDACPNCGQRRPAGVKFYLTEDAAEITDPDAIAKAESGGDWRCKYCGYHNRSYQTECQSCGAQIEDDVERIPVGDYVPTEQLIRRSTSSGGTSYDHPPAGNESSEFELEESERYTSFGASGSSDGTRRSTSGGGHGSWRGWLMVALAALMLVASSWGIYEAFIKTHDVSAHVSGFSWSRETEVEIYGTVREEGWSIPAGGREVSHREKFHHNDRVFDHYESRTRQVPYTTSRQEPYSCTRSNGNGTFSSSTCYRMVSQTNYRTETYQESVYRDVPVYQTWYTYDIEKWHYDRTEKTSGRDQKPHWPEVQVTPTQREGEKTETYILYFTDGEDRQFNSETDLATWQSAQMDQAVTLKLNRQQSLRDFELVVP